MHMCVDGESIGFMIEALIRANKLEFGGWTGLFLDMQIAFGGSLCNRFWFKSNLRMHFCPRKEGIVIYVGCQAGPLWACCSACIMCCEGSI